MVYYFTSRPTQNGPVYDLFMGYDKEENDLLIKHSCPSDVWFHADKISSAHVYYRPNSLMMLDDLPNDLIQDCAQLTKNNSISGNKLDNVNIIYTLSSNLLKTKDMGPGEVNYRNKKKVVTICVETRINSVIRRLQKSKKTSSIDEFIKNSEFHKLKINEKNAAVFKENERLRKEAEKNKVEKVKLLSYESLHKKENMTNNKQEADEDSDDFM